MAIDYKKLGSRIRHLRFQYNYTQKKVNELAGVSIDTQRRIENGEGSHSIETLNKLSILYKRDLLLLATSCRTELDFFSDEFIDQINGMIFREDYSTLRSEVNVIVQEYEALLKANPSDKTINFFISFLDAIKSLDYYKDHFHNRDSMVLQRLLTILSRRNKGRLSDPCLLDIEISAGTILAAYFRTDGDIDSSIKLLRSIIDYLKLQPNLTIRQSDYLTTAYLNIAVAHYAVNNHKRVIETIDEALEGNTIFFCKKTYDLLIVRKIISLKELGYQEYYHLLTYLAQTLNTNDYAMYQRILKKNHGISLPRKFELT